MAILHQAAPAWNRDEISIGVGGDLTPTEIRIGKSSL
jgi:hypothetical protein